MLGCLAGDAEMVADGGVPGLVHGWRLKFPPNRGGIDYKE